MSEFATGYERLQIWTCISNKRSYEGNAAFHIGKRGEAGAVASAGFRFLEVFIGFYAVFSVCRREANGPTGMH
jgi:hypothetical protein